MDLLLDTCILIWWTNNPSKLSPKVNQLLIDPKNSLFLSYVSVWEIQIKSQLGKLELSLPIAKIVRDQQDTNDLQMLPIELKHIYGLENLPHHHRDPFDRLIISQAIEKNIPILSSDSVFEKYSVQCIWK